MRKLLKNQILLLLFAVFTILSACNSTSTAPNKGLIKPPIPELAKAYTLLEFDASIDNEFKIPSGTVITIKANSLEDGEGKTIQGKATLIINNGIQSKIFTVNFKEEITAFDLLKDKAGELNMNLKTKTYNIGIFIEVMGDKENGQDGKYWLYYVNGEIPMIASNKYKIKNGDMVEFKFEESIF